MRVRLLREGAVAPARPRDGDAGYDLACVWADCEPGPYRFLPHGGVRIFPREVVRLLTGIAVDVGAGRVGVVMDRSSVALRGLHVVGGVIDSGYRGEVSVLLANLGTEARGERVAQLLLLPVLTPEVEVVSDLGYTERDIDGFGSSGR